MTDISQTATPAIINSPSAGGGDSQAAAPAPNSPSGDSASPAVVTQSDAAPAAGEASLPSEAPAVEAITETPADSAPAAADTVLGGVENKADTNPDTTKAVDKAEVKTDAPPVDVKVELPTYEDFKVPEHYTVDKDSMGEFSKLLGELETSKLDHKGFQEAGQKLVDMGTKAIEQSITRLNEYYTQIHNQQKTDWFDAFKGDPEIGGKNLPETIKTVRDAVSEFGGSKEQIESLRTVMEQSGVGNNPNVIRLINNLHSEIRKYTTEGDANRMLPGIKPAPSKVKPHQLLYSGA